MKKFLINTISKFPFLYKYLPQCLYYDFDFFMEILKNNYDVLSYINLFLIVYTNLYNTESLCPKTKNLLDDSELCKRVLEKDYACFKYLNKKNKYNMDILRIALACNFNNLKYLSKFFIYKQLNNQKFIDILINSNSSFGFDYLTFNFKKNKDFLLKIFNKKELAFANVVIPKKFGNDIEFMKIACKYCKFNLMFASKRLKKDKTFLLSLFDGNFVTCDEILKYCHSSLLFDCDFINTIIDNVYSFNPKFLTKVTKDNLEIMLKLIKQDAFNYKYASTRLKGNVDIIKALGFRRNYVLIKHFPKRYINNFELMTKLVDIDISLVNFFKPLLKKRWVVENIVKKNGLALEYFSKFQTDFEICKIAIEQNCKAFKFVKININNNENIVELLKIFLIKDRNLNTLSFRFLLDVFPTEYQNKDFLGELFSINGELLQYFQKYSDDFDMVKKAVKSNGNSIRWACSEFRSNVDIVLTALQDKEACDVCVFTDAVLFNNEDIINAMLEQNGENIKFIARYRTITRDMVEKALNNNISAFKYLPSIFLDDRHFVMQAVTQDGLLLKYARHVDEEICFIAVDKNYNAIKYVPDTMYNYKALCNKALLKNISLMEYFVYNTSLFMERKFILQLIDDILDKKADYNIEDFVNKLINYEYPFSDEIIVSKLLDYVNINFEDISDNLHKNKTIYTKCLGYDISLFSKDCSKYFKYDKDIIMEVLRQDFSLLINVDVDFYDEDFCNFIIEEFSRYEISKNYDFEELSIIPQEFVEEIIICVKNNMDIFKGKRVSNF